MPNKRSWRPDARLTSLLAVVSAVFLFTLDWHDSHGTGPTSSAITARHTRDHGVASDGILTSNASLTRREDYTCSAAAPCSNGACCGVSGFCGYGPTYCGAGCLGQCDATAECGQYSKEPGKKCPLNHPSPPKGSSGKVFDKVIGYYESWSNGKSCHNIRPTDLPLDALTHVNYAFAYIDPKSYRITTMDSVTPSSLFDDLTTLKSIKPDLEVWVSLGGWTFSDNNTATQPVFGEISADAGKRQEFANNLLQFMQQHGFDGVDLDWEYPGAPDRGGKKEDTANYVQLLKTLRSTFDGSGGKYGITFTAPSSFWYLRWFDLPGMIRYSDWINFMTYDLHGVWDAQNPIGSIVQGHTNLTEIKLATELLWRVDIPPSKVVLGFGFYGRSFTLADPSCTKPGCPFSGASNPGPCTATGGYLGFYEIQQILKSGVEPIHDTDAAVNYLVFDNNQWISYDDSVTFKQKADWANKAGLGGSMIWASDLDDDKYTAHSQLLGRKIEATSSLQDTKDLLQKAQQLSLTESIKGQTGENCKTYTGGCKDLNDAKALADACGAGNTVVGWDDAGCGKKNHHYGKPICCPTLGAPTSCKWRGDDTGGVGGDCSAECQEGEINVGSIGSSWGGGFTNDGNTNKCRRGAKAFCCVAPDYAAIKKKCSLTDCNGSCSGGSTAMFKYYDDCWFGRYKTYCCPDPAPVSECHWEGDGGDCVNVHCAKDEIELARDAYGDPDEDSWACSWGRSKAACCKMGQVESDPATCSSDMCDVIPGYCPPIDYGDGGGGGDDAGDGLTRRDDAVDSGYSFSVKRGNPKEYTPPRGGPLVTVKAPGYPGPTKLYTTRLATQAIPMAFRLAVQYCMGPSISPINVPIPAPDSIVRAGLESEHVIDVSCLPHFALLLLLLLFALKAFTRIGGQYGPQPDTINGRVMTALGANGYRAPFSLLQKSVNIAKGKVFSLNASPVSLTIIQNLAENAMKLDTKEAADKLLSAIRTGFAVFEYLNQPKISSAWATVNSQMRLQLGYVEQVTGISTLVNWWDVWFADFSDTIGRNGQKWAMDAIRIAVQAVYDANKAAVDAGRPAAATTALLTAQLGAFADSIKKMVAPGLPQVPLLPPPGGSKRDAAAWAAAAGGDGTWSVPETEDWVDRALELDDEVWERSLSGL
ncbi:hypothetical protein B0T24DRAFT_580387 [Lasiosphaeria ovina]|uniref:chitinase n=1 Tax=Lasiosphaeria ovina TaxID=92902 RepID=A0AAE0K4B3_9PEZI|nr:hypothetical protein B0T24DRAFT_580387 [Lasiosphaeria ovina]